MLLARRTIPDNAFNYNNKNRNHHRLFGESINIVVGRKQMWLNENFPGQNLECHSTHLWQMSFNFKTE